MASFRFSVSRTAGAATAIPVLVATSAGAAFLLSGCGSGGGSSFPTPSATTTSSFSTPSSFPTPSASSSPSASPAPSPSASASPLPAVTRQTAPVGVRILWPARSSGGRDIAPPASALSVTVILQGASPTVPGGDFSFTVNRDPNNTAAYTQDAVSPTPAYVGASPLIVQFYAQPQGQGSVVGVATPGTITLTPGGTGGAASGIPNITPTNIASPVASLTVTPGQSFGVGQTVTPAFSAKTQTGDLIAVTPGSVFFAVSDAGVAASTAANSGPVLAAANGQITLLRPGTGRVTLSLDALTSLPGTIVATSNVAVVLNPQARTYSVGGGPDNLAPFISLQNLPAGATGDTTLVLREGAAAGTLQGAIYTPPPIGTNGGTFHIDVVSTFDPSKSSSFTLTVQSANATIGIN